MIQANHQGQTQKFNLFTAAFFLLFLTLFTSACDNRPTKAQLELWQQQAIARNAQMLKVHGTQDTQTGWELFVAGRTTRPQSAPLTWTELEKLATTHITTIDPNSPNSGTMSDFRGVPISQLLDPYGVVSAVREITFLAFDGYSSTVSLEDVRAYPIMIALERDGKPIPRHEGGPVYLTFPYHDYPQLQQKYPDRFWVFYVAYVIAGTEPIELRVGDRIFKNTDLNELTQVTIEETVGYKIGWPSQKVKLRGVRVRDILKAAGLQLPDQGNVIIRGKAPVYRDPNHPIALNLAAIKACDILLATHWGENELQPIPAKMGGPLTLAFPRECPVEMGEQRWVTFVQELEIQP